MKTRVPVDVPRTRQEHQASDLGLKMEAEADAPGAALQRANASLSALLGSGGGVRVSLAAPRSGGRVRAASQTPICSRLCVGQCWR